MNTILKIIKLMAFLGLAFTPLILYFGFDWMVLTDIHKTPIITTMFINMFSILILCIFEINTLYNKEPTQTSVKEK